MNSLLSHLRHFLRRGPGRRASRMITALLLWTVAPGHVIQANPSGGVVVHGDVRMSGAGANLLVHQGSRNAIINWDRFSIAAGESTRFVQPDRASAVLNRVTGGDPTEIHGSLRGNGSIFVINPNGILVGPGGRIDAHGVVLSTLDLDDERFLEGGDYLFKGEGPGGVVNQGRIEGIGGDVFLIGRTIANHGAIKANGTVGMAAGTEVLLTAKEGASGERMFVRAGRSGASGDGIYNDGSIEGAAVELKAHGNVYALAINNKGSIRATGASARGGRVFLEAEGGRVSNGGAIRATVSDASHSAKVVIAAAYARVDGQIRAESGGGKGGEIRVKGEQFATIGGGLDATGTVGAGGRVIVEGKEIEVGSTAKINVNGGVGGEVRIGGGFGGRDPGIPNATTTQVAAGARISANASGDGDAGSVVVWGDDSTSFRGIISAEAHGKGWGGRVEVSGKQQLQFDGVVSTLGDSEARHGVLLLDPTDFEVVTAGAGANQITAAALVALLGGGNVVISTLDAGAPNAEAGDITVSQGANVVWNNANSLTLLAHHDIRVGANLRNSGTGGIHLVAGWDGIAGLPALTGAHRAAGALRADSFATGTFGNAGGSVYIGDGQQNQRISVGSRSGDTQVAGYDVVVRSRDAETNSAQRNAQLGFFDGSNPGAPSGSVHSGNIQVRAVNDIQVLAGTNARAWAQIGHGGNVEGTATGSSYTGTISLMAGRDVVVSGPSTANTGVRSYAQVGHGGAGNGGVVSGTILVDAGRDVNLTSAVGNFSYAQIGHGGYGGSGTVSGSIVVTAGGGLNLTGGEGNATYAQIGHGGASSSATASGGIQIAAGLGGINARGGNAASSYAQVGHGGGLSGADSLAGDILVRSRGDVVFERGRGNVDGAYAMIGHGGSGALGSKAGNLTVESSAGDILFGTSADATGRSAVQIGHGGRDGSGDTSGNIRVSAAGDLLFHGVLGDGNALHREGYAQIGHGGRGNRGNHGNAVDLIDVWSGGDIEFLAGGASTANEAALGREAYAQIGNGGYQSNGNHSGDLVVKALGDIRFDTRGDSGDRAYVQLGHGGYFSSGRFSGNISVDGGAITFLAGRTASYALLGHGGRNDHDSTRDNSGPDGVNNTADDVRIVVNANYAPGTIRGDISVAARGDILFRGGFGAGATGFAQIGHGGYHQSAEVGEGHEGGISVKTTGGAIALEAGTRNSQHAMIGHGGHESFGNHQGDIDVVAAKGISLLGNGGAVTVNGGDVRSFAQIGHGGVDSDFSSSRTLANLGVVNGAAGFHPLIPRTDPGTVGGDITVTVTGDGGGLSLTASQGGTNLGLRGYAQIGHGGLLNEGVYRGDVRVEVKGDVALLGGAVRDSHAQIGHGGGLGGGAISGDLVVIGGGDLTLTGGNFATSNAVIGHGGLATTGARTLGTREGAVVIEMGGATRLIDRTSSAFLGHLAATGLSGVSPFSLISGSLDLGASQVTASTWIANALGSGDVTLAITAGDLVVAGNGYRGESDHRLGLYASGDVRVLSPLQVLGSATIDAVSGWDGATGRGAAGSGLVSFADIDAVRSAWGGNGAFVRIGDGSQTVASALGTRGGLTRILGHGVEIAGGNQGGTSARLGYEGADAEGIDGIIAVSAGSGGLALKGGSGTGAFAQLGNGGRFAAFVSGALVLSHEAGGSLWLQGGTGAGSHTQLGHGSVYHDGTVSGDLVIPHVFEEVVISGGQGQNAFALLGHGGLHGNGDKSGSIDLRAERFTIHGGAGGASFAKVGHGGLGGEGDIDGGIQLQAGAGGIDLAAGGGTSASVQIGHGGGAFRGSVLDSNIWVVSTGNVQLSGGSGLQASVQIGHGGANAAPGPLGGDLQLTSGGDVRVVSGSGGTSYAQIGHGGSAVTADLLGSVKVTADGSLTVQAIAPTRGAYSKIGHGDDLRGYLGGYAGEGGRRGDIQITAGRDLVFLGAALGHGRSPEGALWIAAATKDPANPAAGSLYADGSTTFTSGGDLRIHLPRRVNNRIASGALLNGVIWKATRRDPSATRGIDEYTRYLVGGNPEQPQEHSGIPGSGPVPTTSSGYAFYYDTIVLGGTDIGVLPGEPGPEAPTSPLPVDPVDPLPFEREVNVEIRQHEIPGRHGSADETSPKYEGYKHYDSNGGVRVEGLIDWYFQQSRP